MTISVTVSTQMRCLLPVISGSIPVFITFSWYQSLEWNQYTRCWTQACWKHFTFCKCLFCFVFNGESKQGQLTHACLSRFLSWLCNYTRTLTVNFDQPCWSRPVKVLRNWQTVFSQCAISAVMFLAHVKKRGSVSLTSRLDPKKCLASNCNFTS